MCVNLVCSVCESVVTDATDMAMLHFLQQTYGFMHRRISDMYQLQAYLLSRTTDAVDVYVTYQERAVVIAERVLGTYRWEML